MMIKLKRNSTPGSIPSTSSLVLGELALNTYDGKLYFKQNRLGVDSIITIGPSSNTSSTRVVASTSESLSVAINASITDLATYINTTGVNGGVLTINAPTGSLTEGQRLMIRLKCTNNLTLSFDPVFTGSNDLVLPTTTSSGSRFDYLGFIYNGSKWNLLAKNFGF